MERKPKMYSVGLGFDEGVDEKVKDRYITVIKHTLIAMAKEAGELLFSSDDGYEKVGLEDVVKIAVIVAGDKEEAEVDIELTGRVVEEKFIFSTPETEDIRDSVARGNIKVSGKLTVNYKGDDEKWKE